MEIAEIIDKVADQLAPFNDFGLNKDDRRLDGAAIRYDSLI